MRIQVSNLTSMVLSVVAVALLCSGRGASAQSVTELPRKIRIGAILCLTGNCADWGTAALKGATLYAEEWSHDPKSRFVPEIVVEDTAESISGAKAVTAFNSLYAKGVRIFVGPSWSPGALALIPVLTKHDDVLVITPSASAREFPRASSKVFNMRPPEELVTRALARYAFRKGARTSAILSSQQPAESTQAKIYADEFKRVGGSITAHLEPPPTQTTLSTETLKLVTPHPDAIFVMNYTQIDLGLKELNTLRYDGMRIAISLDEARISSAPTLFEGLIVGRAQQPREKFKAEFIKRFEESPGLSAENGYDSLLVLRRALDEQGSESVVKLSEGLMGKHYDGASGEFGFSADREVIQEPEILFVKGSKLIPLSE